VLPLEDFVDFQHQRLSWISSENWCT